MVNRIGSTTGSSILSDQRIKHPRTRINIQYIAIRVGEIGFNQRSRMSADRNVGSEKGPAWAKLLGAFVKHAYFERFLEELL